VHDFGDSGPHGAPARPPPNERRAPQRLRVCVVDAVASLLAAGYRRSALRRLSGCSEGVEFPGWIDADAVVAVHSARMRLGLGSPAPHLCTGTGLTLPYLHRDSAHPVTFAPGCAALILPSGPHRRCGRVRQGDDVDDVLARSRGDAGPRATRHGLFVCFLGCLSAFCMAPVAKPRRAAMP
jgi:hypothetical protein